MVADFVLGLSIASKVSIMPEQAIIRAQGPLNHSSPATGASLSICLARFAVTTQSSATDSRQSFISVRS